MEAFKYRNKLFLLLFIEHDKDRMLIIELIKIDFLIFVKKQFQELTRVNPDRNIFSINVELTSTFLLYRGLVHHHHRILNKNRLFTYLFSR